jgi:hypothetical protein
VISFLFYLKVMVKDKVYSNHIYTNYVLTKKDSGCCVLRFTSCYFKSYTLHVMKKMLMLDVMCVCEPKEAISSKFFNPLVPEPFFNFCTHCI